MQSLGSTFASLHLHLSRHLAARFAVPGIFRLLPAARVHFLWLCTRDEAETRLRRKPRSRTVGKRRWELRRGFCHASGQVGDTSPVASGWISFLFVSVRVCGRVPEEGFRGLFRGAALACSHPMSGGCGRGLNFGMALRGGWDHASARISGGSRRAGTRGADRVLPKGSF